MKKIITLVLAVALVFGIVSCASSASANQETINKAFAAAYEKYRNYLVMDNAGVHEVKPGDTLTQIAKDRYGSDNGYYFPLIMLASSDVVLDPDLIQPGMKLTIPDLSPEISYQAKPAFRRTVCGCFFAQPKHQSLRRPDTAFTGTFCTRS